MAAEGAVKEGSPDLESWLTQCGIKEKFAKQYVEPLEKLGIESHDDFKFITTKKDFDDLMDNVKKLMQNIDGIRFVDRMKIEKAWKSLHNQQSPGSASNSQSMMIPMDTKEREALENLGTFAQKVQKKMSKYEKYLDNSKFLTQQTNMIREQIASLKDAIDQRGNELIQELQTQYNGIKNECSLEYKKWKDIGIKIHSTKQKCDEALKISDFQQLATRRNTIINSVDETVKIIKVALDDVSIVDNKKIIVDLDDIKGLEQNMKSIGRVYTQCFVIAVTGLSYQDGKLIINWKLKDEKESKLFNKICSKLKVRIGIAVNQYNDEDDDEKKIEQPGDDKNINMNVKWIKDVLHNDISVQQIEVNDKEISLMMKNKTVLVVQIMVLNNKEKLINQTGYECFQCKVDDSIRFVGYVNWEQKLSMGKDEEDNAMNKACASQYNESRSATYKELFDGKITGLIKLNSSPSYVLLASGNGDLWKGGSGGKGNRLFYRTGLNVNKYPWNQSHLRDCSSGTRQTIAVESIFGFKKR